MRSSWLVGVVCLLVLSVAGQAAAAGESDLTPPRMVERLISDATSYEDAPDVVWNAAGDEYLVVWWDYRDYATRGTDIYGQRVGADGVPVGADFRISGSGATSDEFDPEVAWNATGNEYLVVWDDSRNTATRGSEVYGRRVGADGVPVGADFRISGLRATSDEFDPQVAWNGNANAYLVVWWDARNAVTRGSDIYGRRVGANGVPLGGDVRISGPKATGDEEDPQVAWNATANQYLVVWQDTRAYPSESGGADIYGRRVGADAVLSGGDVRISGPKAVVAAYDPQVAWNATANQYLVVWGDSRDYSTSGSAIYGRRVGADGVLSGGDVRISGPKASGDEGNPQVAWNATANQYLVVWRDGRDYATRNTDIYAKRVGADGVLSGGDVRISGPNATAGESDPQVAWNATANQHLVVWVDWRDEGARGSDIYGRRLTGDPAPAP